MGVGVISACGSGSSNPCSKRVQTPAPPTVVLALERQSLTVSLEFPNVIACAGGNPVATSVETQVLDARQQPVPHSATAPTSSNTGSYATSVTFTPLTPGLYSLSARFEPSLAIARREVLVVVDRTASTPVAAFRPEAPCEGVAELGAFTLCASASRGVDVFLDGGLAATWPADTVAFAPGAAWTLSRGRATRWTVEDGGLSSASLVGVTADAVGLTHAATDDMLQVVAGADFTEVGVDGGALEVRRRAALSVASSGRSGLLVPGGDALAFDALALDGGPLSDDAADAGVRSVCHVPLGETDAGVLCTPLLLALGAREGDALWLRAAESKRVGLLRYLGDAPPPSVTFLAAQPNALVDQGKPLPLFTWNTFAVVVRANDFILEAFAPPPRRVRTGASTTHVWFVTSDGDVVLHRR
jgi:hypothetical protein